MTKQSERQTARLMRSSGKSVNVIARELRVSKSSVLRWVADLPRPTFSLSDEATTALRSQAQRNQIRASRNRREKEDLGFVEASNTDDRRLWAFAALYWGEGTKHKNTVKMGSSDPQMLSFFTSFLVQHMHAPVERMSVTVHIHPGLDVDAAERFWCAKLGLPTSCLRKAQICVPRSSKKVTEHRCPFGTAHVAWHDTDARSRISGWIRALLPLS